MKYFTALTDAAFARGAFSAAGLDFDAAIAAKDADVLKKAIDAAKASAKPAVDAEAVLAQAAKENADLAAKVAELEKSKSAADNFVNLSAAVEAAGIKLADATDKDGKIDAAKIQEQHKASVSKAARDMIAAAGHPGVLDTPAADASKPAKQANENVKGEDRLRADFNAQLRNLNLPRNQRN